MPTGRFRPAAESIERLGKKVAGTVVQDIKESLLGDVKKLSPQEKEQALQAEQQNKQKLQVIRQNIAAIDKQMAEYRKKREQKPVEEQQAQEQKQVKKYVEKQQKDSVLAKIIKSRKGTKEAMQRASG